MHGREGTRWVWQGRMGSLAVGKRPLFVWDVAIKECAEASCYKEELIGLWSPIFILLRSDFHD